MRCLVTWLLSLPLLLTLPALAQDAPTPPRPLVPLSGWVFHGYVEQMSFDQRAADREGIKPEALALGLGVESYTSAHRFNTAFGFAFIVYDDNEAFRQQVRDNRGRISSASSDASALELYGEFGPRFQLGDERRYFATLRAGANLIIESTRTIPNCSNCHKEKIDIDGGLYGAASIGINLNSVSWALRYRHFLSGDQEGAVSLVLAGKF